MVKPNEPPPFMAFRTKDGAEVVMMRGAWRHRIPAADLPRWLALYRGLWSRRQNGSGDGKTPGPWAPFHAGAVAALESLAAKEAK